MGFKRVFIVAIGGLLFLSACGKSVTSSHDHLFFAKNGTAYLYDLEDNEVVQTKSFDFSEPVYGVKYNPETEEIFFLTSSSWVADSEGHGEEDCTEHARCYAKIYKSTWGSDPTLLLDITGRIYEWNLAGDGLYTIQYTPEEGRQFTRLNSSGSELFSTAHQFDDLRNFGDLDTFKGQSYQVNGTLTELYLSSFDNAKGSIETEKIYENPLFVDANFTNIAPDETVLQFYGIGLVEEGYELSTFLYDLQQKLLTEIKLADFDRTGKTIWAGNGRKFTIGLTTGLSYYDLDDGQFHKIVENTYTPLAWAPLDDKIILLADEGAMSVYNFIDQTLTPLPEEFQAYNLIDIDGLEVFASTEARSN